MLAGYDGTVAVAANTGNPNSAAAGYDNAEGYGTGTGAAGISNTLADALNGAWGIATKPFAGSLSAIDLGLIVGVLMIAAIAWNFILFHIRAAAETI